MFRTLRIDNGNSALTNAQMRAFSKQVPLLYLILLINTFALSYTHLGVAPAQIGVGFPLALAAACLVRLVTWVRAHKLAMTDEQAAHRLRSTVVLAVVLGAAFTWWALTLYGYGNPYQRAHVTFYIGITVVSCIFCLMHLRSAALGLTAVVTIPFAGYMILTQQPVFIAIAFNMLLVALAMVYVLLVYSRDFATMVTTQEKLTSANKENFRLANLDSLTELPNRRCFFAHLAETLDRATSTAGRFAVAIVDLDGFKPINDVHGHATGDRVLIETGRRMRAALGDDVFVARLGGDEFGLIFETWDDDAIVRACNRLCKELEVPMHITDAVLRVAGSVGIATYPDAGTDTGVLFERADYALYAAKNRQRGRALLFSEVHETAIRRERVVEEYLREAALEAEMEVVFQPILDLATERVVSFEALARWRSPVLGQVSPAEFIRGAEHTGQISELTCVLLRKALAAAQPWPEDVAISFNLSALDISSAEAIDRISMIILASGIHPSRLDMEITETALIVDYDQAIDSLNRLKQIGVKISLDDFGTGHSSLSQLQKLPIDQIKIDRSFISDLDTNTQSFNIVKSVLVLSKSLGLDCVVEGVETAEQVAILETLHAEKLQGFLFSKPIAAQDVAEFLATNRRTSAAA
jgi:diguanylate cyclase (GGDEF)-like protein